MTEISLGSLHLAAETNSAGRHTLSVYMYSRKARKTACLWFGTGMLPPTEHASLMGPSSMRPRGSQRAPRIHLGWRSRSGAFRDGNGDHETKQINIDNDSHRQHAANSSYALSVELLAS